MVDFADAAFLHADRTGEIAEVVGGQRNIGVQRLADRLAVIPGFRMSQGFEILLDAIGDAVEDVGALGGRRLAPGVLGGVGSVQRGFHVVLVGTRDTGEDLAGDRRDVVKILATLRRHPLAADVVVVLLAEDTGRVVAIGFDWCDGVHGFPPRNAELPMTYRKRHAMLLRNTGFLRRFVGSSRPFCAPQHHTCCRRGPDVFCRGTAHATPVAKCDT